MEQWVYWPDIRQNVQVLKREWVWGREILHVWVPGQDQVAKVPADSVQPPEAAPSLSLAEIRYRVAAAQIAEALAEGILLAPLEGRVEPLPHQLAILRRVVTEPRIRLLLADEVGLGKTIEAGLIIRELKLRGLARRILVVAPKGLVSQWVAEMKLRFDETFRVVSGSDIRQGQLMGLDSLWEEFDQVIVSQDAMKPLDKRKSWSDDEIERYNQERFEAMVAAGWDLVVVDEAHRLSGTTDLVARFKLGEGLAASAPSLLLLSATPHQGKTEQFRRLLSLLDPDQFIDDQAITPDRVQPYVVRTEKRSAVDRHGNKLFQPRRVTLVPISWDDPRFFGQRDLYWAVSDYVRHGVEQAHKDRAPLVALRLLMLQRMVASSTAAIRQALENRLAILKDQPREVSPLMDADDDERALLETGPVLSEEEAEITRLLALCDHVAAQGPDARALRLVDLLHEIQQRENTLAIKVLIFTEFLPTQAMLRDFLTRYGFSVVILNGSMDLTTRILVQQQFRDEAQVLISSEAGGEGLNLQFCHIVINYDLPWNPMRIEQRIGRVDRIGQTELVEAYNFLLKDTVEYRVQEVLLEKLDTILAEFGIDKLGDVLDSGDDDLNPDDLLADLALHPEDAEARLQAYVDRVRQKIQGAQETGRLFHHETPDPRLVEEVLHHPFALWLKTAVTHYCEARGGQVKETFWGTDLIWPDGRRLDRVVFRAAEAEGGGTLLTLETPGVMDLIQRIPEAGPEDDIPVLILEGIARVEGIWSLWAVELASRIQTWRRYFPVFLSQDGRVFPTTAQAIWQRLLDPRGAAQLTEHRREGAAVIDQVRPHAEKSGEPLFRALLERHQAMVRIEREKVSYAFSARQKLIERVGLSEVRQYRLRQLQERYAEAMARIDQLEQVVPALTPVVIAYVEGRHG
ncbi:MAG: helicase-related protein [Sulfobacillus sp.]|nr:helicase-related protein [Sulfobacillus sp.]